MSTLLFPCLFEKVSDKYFIDLTLKFTRNIFKIYEINLVARSLQALLIRSSQVRLSANTD
jgi:hypothetical protein